MNAIDLLIQDHALVKKLLEELCATTPGSAVKTRRHPATLFKLHRSNERHRTLAGLSTTM